MVGVVCINRGVVSGMVRRSFCGVILWWCALVIHGMSGGVCCCCGRSD